MAAEAAFVTLPQVNDLLQRTAEGLRRHRLLPPGQRLLVAVSGGADSMVLLHLLYALAPENGWNLAIAHFNHRLRGRASDADEALVRRTAKRLGLPFFGERGDVSGFARRAKISTEMAARKLRHEFLARVARAADLPIVALAHHADDQVELFFLRLLRGAGGEGLAGMKRRSPSPATPQLSLVRPLLDFTKEELLAYARENKIRFREDASNRSADPLRNRLRLDLLPRLRRLYQPGLTATVRRAMEIVGEEAEFAADTARAWLRAPEPPATFGQLPTAVQRQAIAQQLSGLRMPPEFELIEQLRQSPGKLISAGPGLFLVRDAAGQVVWHPPTEKTFQTESLAVQLVAPRGKVTFAERAFRWEHKPLRRFAKPTPMAGREILDADRVGEHITLRHWRPGDRFQPIGLNRPAKLQDLFVNAKIPADRRRQLVVAETGEGTLFWVEGLRLAEGFKLTPATRRQLIWRWT